MNADRFNVRKSAARVLIFILALCVGGCADLSAIRQFADQSVEAAQYRKLLNEFAESPIRQKPFQPAAEQAALDRQARERAAEKTRLQARLKGIEEYMSALGRLAADEAADYDKEVDSIGKAVGDAKFVDAGQAEALGTIAKILVKAVADGWRQKELHNLIEQANPPFQVVVKAQREIVAKDFTDSLRNEEAAINAFYDNFLRNPDASKEPIAVEALKELRTERVESFPARRKAVSDYAAVLDKIAAGHQELFERRNEIHSDVLIKRIRQYAKDIQTLMKAVKDL